MSTSSARVLPDDPHHNPLRVVGAVPLIVDLDGCLIRTDLLWEGLVCLVTRRPWRLAGAVRALARHGRSGFKGFVAEHGAPALDSIPFDPAVVRLVEEARADGRPVMVMSGAAPAQVAVLAQRAGILDSAGSDAGVNLIGHAKLAAIRSRFAVFDYVGNSAADLPVWAAARRAYAAPNTGPVTRRRARHACPGLMAVAAPTHSARAWQHAVRPHQWSKNLLLFLPGLAAHLPLSLPLLGRQLMAFASFSLAASAAYLINDLIDLPHDRVHPTKQTRPFAAGDLTIQAGIACAILAMAGSATLAVLLPWKFAATLLVYFVLTIAYSTVLKREPILDVVVLAMLYTMRTVAGAAVAEVRLTAWFVGFSVFFFTSLALVKRAGEVRQRSADTGHGIPGPDVPGRGYVQGDLPVLISLGAGAAMASALVYGLYIAGEDVRVLYAHPFRLWAGLPLLLYWLARVWLLTGRGAMHDDPVVFALRDRVSVVTFIAFVAVVAVASH